MSSFYKFQNTCNNLGMRRGELTVDRATFSALWHDAPPEMRRPGASHVQTWLRRPMGPFVRSEAISPEHAAFTVSVDARVNIPLAFGEHIVVRMEEP